MTINYLIPLKKKMSILYAGQKIKAVFKPVKKSIKYSKLLIYDIF